MTTFEQVLSGSIRLSWGLLLVGFGVADAGFWLPIFQGLPGRAFRLCLVPSRGTWRPPWGMGDYRRYHPAGEQPPVVQGHGPTTAATTPKGSSHPSAKGTPDFCRSRRSVEGAAWRPSVGAVAAAESLDLASDKSHGYPGGTLDANGGVGCYMGGSSDGWG